MSSDMNELGAGLAETLKQTKQCFGTCSELARVMDDFYNGKFAREWPEVNPLSNLKQFGTMARYKVAWEHAHDQIRPSAAATAVERVLDRVRYFANVSVPQIKVRVTERNQAGLDLDSYKRRYESMQKKDPQNPKVPYLEQKFRTATERFENLNTALKDDLVKEKIARDVLLEESVITFAVCQHEMFKELVENLKDIVDSMPQDKVSTIRLKIQDLISRGGPQVKQQDENVAKKGLNIALGRVAVTQYIKSDEQIRKEKEEETKRQALAAKVAVQEDTMRLKGSRVANTVPSVPYGRAGGGGAAATSLPKTTAMCKALYDCEAEGEGDLAFRAGDIISVTNKDDSGWWEGTCNGRSGQFPANYVTPI